MMFSAGSSVHSFISNGSISISTGSGFNDNDREEKWVDYYDERVLQSYMVRQQHAKQPYSVLMAGGLPLVVMWDSCCTLVGLITEDMVEKIAESQPGVLLRRVALRTPRAIGGISKGQCASLVGEVDLKLCYLDREMVLTFGVLRNGSTGSAHAMVGNVVMHPQHYDGAVDVGRRRMLFRRLPDGLGEVSIPISFEFEKLGAGGQVDHQGTRVNAASIPGSIPAAMRAETARPSASVDDDVIECYRCEHEVQQHQQRHDADVPADDVGSLWVQSHLELLPGQTRIVEVLMCDIQGGRRGETAFVLDDGVVPAIDNIEVGEAQAVFESDGDGRCYLPVTNVGPVGMALDEGELVGRVRMLDHTEIVSALVATDEQLKELSDADKQLCDAVMRQSHACERTRQQQSFTVSELREDTQQDSSTGGATDLNFSESTDVSKSTSGLGNRERVSHKHRCLGHLEYKEVATWDDLMSNLVKPKFIFGKIDASVFERPDVVPSGVFYSGIGGVSRGSIVKRGDMWIIAAFAIEADPDVALVHQWNNPSVPVIVHRMVQTSEVLKRVKEHLPRKFWGRAWFHASNSCKLAAHANMMGRDIDKARHDTIWAIQLLQTLGPAVWTLENVPSLYPFFKGKFPTANVFQMNKHCDCGQDRRRLIVSNRALYLPRREHAPRSMRDVLGKRKGWDPSQFLLQRNGWGGAKSVDHPSYTVTSGYMQAGAPYVGDFSQEHILSADDRALLQGFDTPLVWPSDITESSKKGMIAQCVIPGFARVLSEAAYSYQVAVHKAGLAVKRLSRLGDVSEAEAMSVFEAMCAHEPEAQAAEMAEEWAMKAEVPLPSSWMGDFGVHGTWVDHGEELGWARDDMSAERLRQTLWLMPWLKCKEPPKVHETRAQFHKRREREKAELNVELWEQQQMQSQDVDAAGAPRGRQSQSQAGSFASRQFRNVHPTPDALARWDSNAELQRSDPENYGPYLEEGESYAMPRNSENLARVCKEMGLDELPDELKAERPYYESLVYDYWILFDGRLRAIKGVEIDVDLSEVKPIRMAPYRWSPVKVAAGRKIIEEFVKEGIMGPISSEWAWPALLVPKPKGGWRFVVDLRELNKLIPHDTYEPPSCDSCLEWLAGKPFRSTLDLLHGFHGVALSPNTQKIFTVVTPFGTYCYKRLVMGYINATAEFQRHTNATFGELLWKNVLSMVDDVCIGSGTKEEHRSDVRQAFDRLARRWHSVKPTKASLLRPNVEYLGHISTPRGLMPSDKHVKAIKEMPPPLDEDSGLVSKTRLRSFLGMVKFERRYIKNCGRLCDPLNQELRDDASGVWTAEMDMVFNRLKTEIVFTKGVWHVDYKLPIYICTDGSKRGIGGYMFQRVDGEERVIGYYSRATRPDERKWDTRELEVLAVIATLENFHHYIEGVHVHLQTDHKNITWLSGLKKLTGRLGRWVLRLSEYKLTIAYKKGRFMYVADCLSRNSRAEDEEQPDVTERPPRGVDVPDAVAFDGRMSAMCHWDGDGAIEALVTALAENDVSEQGGQLWMVEFNVSEEAERMVSNAEETERAWNAAAMAFEVQHQSSSGGMAMATSVANASDVGNEPIDVPDELLPDVVSLEDIRRAQQQDEFARMMMRRCDVARCDDARAAKFRAVDGVLYRHQKQEDPREGVDALRAYIPPGLRLKIIFNHHGTVFSAHRNAHATFKEIAALYYWNTMARDVQDFVSSCEVCQLAKGLKPSRQGFLTGWHHNKVLHQVCMDLMGPFDQQKSGLVHHPKPIYLLVITDPFSHMIWLETLYGKSAEELFEKFVTRFLCEEGCPRVILTDNGKEFDNRMLRELMRLCRIRLKFTPPYHPRGNYTERVNRFIGTTLRALVNSEGGRRQDWFKFIKFVQLAYRRMHIPGTNISPNMVARGRQPVVPTELPALDEGVALTAGSRNLDEHVAEVQRHMKAAEQLLSAAREKALKESRERFNSHQVEVVFEPGQLVRYFNYVPVSHKATGDGVEKVEISSKLKLRNAKYRVVSRQGSVYVISNVETGKERRAHVSQLARMRELVPTAPAAAAPSDDGSSPGAPSGASADRMWDRMRVGSFVVVWLKDDPKSVLRVLEVTQVNPEQEEFSGWYNIHSQVARHYNAERPLNQMRATPEYERNGKSGFVLIKKDLHRYTRLIQTFEAGEFELVHTGFNLESGGKIPRSVCLKADAWLRRASHVDPRAIVALSEPTEAEQGKITQLQAAK